MKTPYFDDLVPLKEDALRFQVYQFLPFQQRLAFGDLGIQFVYKIKRITKPQAFHLTYRLVEWYEKQVPPENTFI